MVNQVAEGGSSSDFAATRGKIVALELLKTVLENAGPGVVACDKFVGAMRHYLCAALLKNHGSSVPQVCYCAASTIRHTFLRCCCALAFIIIIAVICTF